MEPNVDSKIDPKAACVRQVSNWPKVRPEHKFDKASFDPAKMTQDIEAYSPKLQALLENIERLDAQDRAQHGKVFKHLIFSDVKMSGYGAKIIAAGLAARRFHHAYDERMQLDAARLAAAPYRNFALLVSTTIYGKPIPVRFRKELMALYNSKDNVQGKAVRILVLDSGFKEGLDVFDVRYLHMFEPLVSLTDEKQVIGRATRMCGQKNLEFHPKYGWKLDVFTYDARISPTQTAFQLFVDHLGLDLRRLVFARALEQASIYGAVDYELTKKLHTYNNQGGLDAAFFRKLPDRDLVVRQGAARPQIVKYGQKFAQGQPLRCQQGCSGATMAIPTELMLIVNVVTGLNTDVLSERFPRSTMCRQITEQPKYCAALNVAWHNPLAYVFKHQEQIGKRLRALQAKVRGPLPQIAKIEAYMKNVQYSEPANPAPPLRKMNHAEMRAYIGHNFGEFAWKDVQPENGCVGGSKRQPAAPPADAQIVEFTPSQQFVLHFFQPSSAYKGMLLWHGVGTGKTCCAVAATSAFARAKYTILWVTRQTLKADVWKNIFDQICEVDLQERVAKEGLQIPADRSERMKLLGDVWIQPISYRQFSNMVLKKNSLYGKMAERNGEEDILRRTLVVFDEAHKLFARDLVPGERPDVAAIMDAIQRSYERSAANSVRLLLMSATPYNTDPMDLIRLLNMLRPDDKFTESFYLFTREYLDVDGDFTPMGLRSFLNKVSGYISYLNRERDIRQFAQPALHSIVADISRSQDASHLVELSDEIDVLKMDMALKKDALKGLSRGDPLKPLLKQEMAELSIEIREKQANLKKAKDAAAENISQEAALASCVV